ncbi:MAG: FG-GAP repeat protein [Saprospiraceae bacterium]|nr:FG-GAP repeat protein [Saprospiraceae bacterium]
MIQKDKLCIYMMAAPGYLLLWVNDEGNAPLTKKQASDGITDDYFGFKVAVDGDYAVVSAPHAEINNNQNQGAVYVFYKNNGEWQQQTKLYINNGSEFDYFGYNVAIDGNHIVVGQIDGHKYVHVFERTGSVWTYQQK